MALVASSTETTLAHSKTHSLALLALTSALVNQAKKANLETKKKAKKVNMD